MSPKVRHDNTKKPGKSRKKKLRPTATLEGFFSSPSMAHRRIALLLLSKNGQGPAYFVGDGKGIRENWKEIASFDAVYFGINPSTVDATQFDAITTGSIGRVASTITRIKFILIDVDPVRPPETCATGAEKGAAKSVAVRIQKYLKQIEWPSPWIFDSGNGFQLLIPADLDVEDSELVKRFLLHLAGKFDVDDVKVDTSVADLARVCRLPTTMNRKGQNTPERPHRQSRVVIAPRGREPANVVTRPTLIKVLPQEANISRSEEQMRSDVLAPAKNYISKMEPSISGRGGHNRLFAAACKAIELGCNRSEARHVLLAEFNDRCEPPWSDREIEHKLDDAIEKVTGKKDPLHTVAALEPVRAGATFFGFIPDWADFCYDTRQYLFNPTEGRNSQEMLIQHFALMQFKYRTQQVPQEFVRQFYYKQPLEQNWRARLPQKINSSDWRAVDDFRSPRIYDKCIFCSSGYESHTHFQIASVIPKALLQLFAVRLQNGKLSCAAEIRQQQQRNDAVAPPVVHKHKDSFLYLSGSHQELYKKLKKEGVIRKAYWPTLLLGRAAGLSADAIRALFGITNELTRSKRRSLIVSDRSVPLVRKLKGICPILDTGTDYVIFGGNRRNGVGQGYTLFGRTGNGWNDRLLLPGKALQKNEAPLNQRQKTVAEFVFGKLFAELIPPEFGLKVAAYHSGKREWKGLADLQRACRSKPGLNWIDKSTIRIFAPVDWTYRWRDYLSKTLGYSWIPSTSTELAPQSHAELISTPEQLSNYILETGCNRDELADELSLLAGYSISKKKIQRHLSGETQTPKFDSLISEFLGRG